jgi:hypothetical protein
MCIDIKEPTEMPFSGRHVSSEDVAGDTSNMFQGSIRADTRDYHLDGKAKELERE